MVKNGQNFEIGRKRRLPGLRGPQRRRDRAAGEIIKTTVFENSLVPGLGIEALGFRDLQRRAHAEHFAAPERMAFYTLMLVTAGRGVHELDFVAHPLRRGALFLVQPGQVQQFHFNASLDARMIVFDPVFLLPARHGPIRDLLFGSPWTPCSYLPPPLLAEVLVAFGQIGREISVYARQGGDATHAALIQQLLYALLLRIKRFANGEAAAEGDASRSRDLVHRFRQLLAEHPGGARSVARYASLLACSGKTLTRACLAIEGATAKDVIDARVALEAKRMLAHSEHSVAQIAAELGFSEPTNFLKFFRRLAGMTPRAFRLEARRGMAPAAAASATM